MSGQEADFSAARGRIWINSAELSGDMHGAGLLKALRTLAPGLEFSGMGGPHLRAAGLDCRFNTEALSVMGITEVLGRLPRIFKMLRGIEHALKTLRPAAVVVIDAPDFHFRVIHAARRLDIPVYYYISPKVWAWRPERARFIKANVRRLLSILPFEREFYRKYGLETDYVGNPLLDSLDLAALDKISPISGQIGFMPGSRRSEVRALMPRFAAAAQILAATRPGLSFHCARAPGLEEAFLRAFWPADLPLTLREPDSRYTFMRECALIIAASGTAALETALAGTPTLVTYKVSALSGLVGRLLIKVPYVSLPNIILNRPIFPELLQNDCRPENIARRALDWLDSPNTLQNIRTDLNQLRQILGGPGAARRAAKLILQDLAG